MDVIRILIGNEPGNELFTTETCDGCNYNPQRQHASKKKIMFMYRCTDFNIYLCDECKHEIFKEQSKRKPVKSKQRTTKSTAFLSNKPLIYTNPSSHPEKEGKWRKAKTKKGKRRKADALNKAIRIGIFESKRSRH